MIAAHFPCAPWIFFIGWVIAGAIGFPLIIRALRDAAADYIDDREPWL